MKKFTAFLLATLTILSLSACTNSTQESDSNYTTEVIKASVLDYNTSNENEYANLEAFEITPNDTARLIQGDPETVLIDVREQSEYDEANIGGSILIPLGDINRKSLMDNNVKMTDNIVLYCRSGNRSTTAYELLQQLGYYNSNSMAGGITAWMQAGLPVAE